MVPGCIDFAVFEPSRIPPALAGRQSYDHNPEFRLIRTSPEEMLTIAGVFAERLNQTRGSIHVAIPTQGLSIPNTPDGPFWDPDADEAFRDLLRKELREDIPVSTHEYHVNDPEFGRLVARLFLNLIQETVS